MKSERRHELQKNELADRLASGIESTRSLLPVIGIVLAVMLVGAIGWGVYNRYSRGQASAAWTDFYFNLTSGDADSFSDLAADYPHSAAAGWALQIAGDALLQRGIASMYRNRTEAKELIGKAISEFEKVDQAANNPELRAKALLGLAQAHESLGELEQAASFYQQLSKVAGQPGLANEANQRLAFVTSDAGKNFYNWFSQLDPKPDAPITLPSDLSLPPASPDLEFGPSDTELNSALGNAFGSALSLPTETAPAASAPSAAPAPSNTPADTSTLADTSSAPALPAAGKVPALKLDDQPSTADANATQPEPKPEPKPETKPEPKPEPKAQNQPEPQPEAKPQPQTDAPDAELDLPPAANQAPSVDTAEAPAEGPRP